MDASIAGFYPKGPKTTPPNLYSSHSKFKRDAWLAIVGILAFVFLYIFITSWFTWTAYRLIFAAFENPTFIGFAIGLPSAFIAFFLIKALFSIKYAHNDTNLIEVIEKNEPDLYRFIINVADDAGAPRPHKIFLSMGVNACVFYNITALNFLFPSKKNLEIGLALMNTLSLSEFKAVLAHEFGHFSQKSMAVGNYVYLAKQITEHIVFLRSFLDKTIDWISYSDIRIAWFGWLLYWVVWSIRSVLETAFKITLLAERTLSREMELQADLVSVSLTGSDSLINALHKMQASDESWQEAIHFSYEEIYEKRITKDIFTIQNKIIEHKQNVLDDPSYGVSPKVKENGASHKVFSVEDTQVPRMWATHPENFEREENAKRLYIHVEQDDRSACLLFSNKIKMNEEMTAKLISNFSKEHKEAKLVDMDASITNLNDKYSLKQFNKKYFGLYLNHSIVLYANNINDLYLDSIDETKLGEIINQLYPNSLKQEIKNLQSIKVEKDNLIQLRDNIYQSSGSIIKYRGKAIKKKELTKIINDLDTKFKKSHAIIIEHDKLCRVAHRAIATYVDLSWRNYLISILSTLHYIEHSRARAKQYYTIYTKTIGVETASGKVNAKGLSRIISASKQLHKAMSSVYIESNQVYLNNIILKKLKTTSWEEYLGKFELPLPTNDNIQNWSMAISSWYGNINAQLESLGQILIEELLITEDLVEEHFNNKKLVMEAPEVLKHPQKYEVYIEEENSNNIFKLNFWARFKIGDGFFPETIRMIVASSILGSTLYLGSFVDKSEIIIFNGLARNVEVEIGNEHVEVPQGGSHTIEVNPNSIKKITSKIKNGPILESFEVPSLNTFQAYVYNIRRASPFVVWEAYYGSARPNPDLNVGNPLWLPVSVDYYFREPPESIKISGTGETRKVITGYGLSSPNILLSLLKDEKDSEEAIRQHAKWDNENSSYIFIWLYLAEKLKDIHEIILQRLQLNPYDVMALRTEQDIASEIEKPKVLKKHRELALNHPEIQDLQYIGIRAMENEKEKDQAFLAGYIKYPENPWFAFAGGRIQAQNQDFKGSLKSYQLCFDRIPSMKYFLKEKTIRLERYINKTTKFTLPDNFDQGNPAWLYFNLENNIKMEKSPYRAYLQLQSGNITEALKTSRGTPIHANVLWLVAASDGAEERNIENAFALKELDGIEDNTVWIAIALKLKLGKKIDAELNFLKSHFSKIEFEPIEGFLKNLNQNTNINEISLNTLDLDLKQIAEIKCALLVFLGDKVPPEYKDSVKYLLFCNEKPYFKE